MKYKVSVIIPVYNAEKTLDRTINSVINQSMGFENIELILIDDSSKDNSKNVIEKYVNRYENIVAYFSEINHGFPGFGRNMGIKMATSEYVMFLDNDDEYDVDICKKLYQTITSEEVDVVACDRIIVDYIGKIKDSYMYSGGYEEKNGVVLKNEEILSFCCYPVWSKIFKKQIIDDFGLKFFENTGADDVVFSIEYYLKSNKLIYLEGYYGYRWNVRDESLSHEVHKDQIFVIIDSFKYIVDVLKNENMMDFSDNILKYLVLLLIGNCSYTKASFSDFSDILSSIRNFEIESNFNYKFDALWLEIINKLIFYKLFVLAIICLRIINFSRKLTLLRKLNRR